MNPCITYSHQETKRKKNHQEKQQGLEKRYFVNASTENTSIIYYVIKFIYVF